MGLKQFIKRILIYLGLIARPEQNSGVSIHVSNDSIIKKGNNVELKNCHIDLINGSTMILHDNVEIECFDIYLDKGVLEIGENTKLLKGRQSLRPRLRVNGKLQIKDHCIIKNDFWIRFDGICRIGSYTGICEETEIRCDERVDIGSFNMISYQCQIYDTNTHCIYPKEKRRSITINDFPSIGNEFEKPITSPVAIGDDCWIGKRAVILKGSTLGNQVIVGTNSVVSKKIIADNSKVYGNPAVVRSE